MKGTNLKFTDLKVKDQGNYTCVAQNTEGSIEFTFVVEVIGKLGIKNTINVFMGLTLWCASDFLQVTVASLDLVTFEKGSVKQRKAV